MGTNSSLPSGSDISTITKRTPIDHITISIRGSRKTGKTSLVTRMQAKKMYPDYSATPIMSATEVMWKSITKENELISITIWDVVDKAIRHLDVDPDKPLPDATTVDTFSRADGVVIMYDPRNPNTVKYAVNVIKEAPKGMPIAVLCNFADKMIQGFGMPAELREFSDRIIHVHTSMTSNQGLGTVAKWLDLPLLYHRKRQYAEMMKAAKRDFEELTEALGDIVAEENKFERDDKGKRVYSVPQSSIIPSGSRDNLSIPGRPTLFVKPGEKNTEEESKDEEENAKEQTPPQKEAIE